MNAHQGKCGDSARGMDFTVFISGLMAEGLVAIGVLKNPMTNETKKDLRHAAMVIDTLDMLKEKTKGNLAKEEAEDLEHALHQLRMLYVASLDEGAKGAVPGNIEGKDQI